MKSYRILYIAFIIVPCCLSQGNEIVESSDTPESNSVVDDDDATGTDLASERDTSPSTDSSSGGDSNTLKINSYRDIKQDMKTVCSASQLENEHDMKINLTDILNYEDMLRLMTWNLKYDLKSGKKSLKLDESLTWKREIIELIYAVFKKGCPTEYVPAEFINIAREFGMIYLNSVKRVTLSQKRAWNKTINALRVCPEKVTPLKFRPKGFQAEYLVTTSPDGGKGQVQLFPPIEKGDDLQSQIDTVIDTMWWMFSFSFASCSPMMGSKAIGLAQYRKLFYDDILVDLIHRWINGGWWAKAYGPIFGDINISQALVNIRYCVTAAYTSNGLADRQLVRPLYVVSSRTMHKNKITERNFP